MNRVDMDEKNIINTDCQLRNEYFYVRDFDSFIHSFDRLDKKIYIFILEIRKIENPVYIQNNERREKTKWEMK